MTPEQFEDEVRNIARALWPSRPGQGGSLIIDGRERDCIFVTEDLIHYLEITKDRSLAKVKSDVTKMTAYRNKMQKAGQPVKLWFVTYFEPTADQRTLCQHNGVEALSLKQFSRRIIDASQYLETRLKHPFGSAVDPFKESRDLSHLYYQPVNLLSVRQRISVSLEDIANQVVEGKQILLLGDYGMGKSLAIFQIFKLLKRIHDQSSGDIPVPVVLNLREHWGQVDPNEALKRHAASIGFIDDFQLARALNSGRISIILDGFDEIASTPWNLPQGEIKQVRAAAVKLVRNFADRTRGKCGFLVAGREHFFDDNEELQAALGMRGSDQYQLNEFSDQETNQALRKWGVQQYLPDWFPTRPLLLSTLVARGLLESVLQVSDEADPPGAWEHIVNLICEREAKIHQYLDANSIRRILQLLATNVRRSPNNLGPVTESAIAEAFRSIVGAYPDNDSRPLLLRLPCLTGRSQPDGSREFLDDQLVDVLRGLQIAAFFEDPFTDPEASEWLHGLGDLGVQVAVRALGKANLPSSKLVVAAREAMNRWNSPTLALDVIQITQTAHVNDSKVSFDGLLINGGHCQELDLYTLPYPKDLTLKECIIQDLVLPSEQRQGLRLESCLINRVHGATSETELPNWISSCMIEDFDSDVTNSAILENKNIPLTVRILLTILRKIYLQKGSGRRENSLYRGLGLDARPLVPSVLEIVQKQKLSFNSVRRGYSVWQPVSGQRGRVEALLEVGHRSGDPVIKLCQKIEC